MKRSLAGIDVDRSAYGRSRRGLVVGGLLLGSGLGGFVDGILLHQILQWHHLLTDSGRHRAFPTETKASLEVNTLGDGMFQAVMWMSVVVGLVVLWRWATSGPDTSTRRVLGLLLTGWGSFNFIEGVLSHHILGIHHVRDDVANPLAWDLGFLLLSLALILVGLALWRSDKSSNYARFSSTS